MSPSSPAEAAASARQRCLLLAKAGYLVVVNYVANAQAAKAIVAQIEKAGGKAVAVQGDVASERDIMALFMAADQYGRLKILINNAGVIDVKSTG